MQVTVGPQTYWGMGAQRFADLVRSNTGGRINIKPYFGSQLLKGAQLHAAQMVASGGVDLAFESTINTAPVIPEMNVFCLPFFVNTYDRLDRMEQGQCGTMIFHAMRKKGLEPLGWGENGFRQITNSKHPIRTPDDLKELKVRVVGSPLFTDLFRHWGADPVNMNWGDAVTAFQQGAVDAQENPAAILTAVQINQYHKYATFWNYVIDPLILYWNKKEWDAFPADVQDAIRAAAIQACRYEKALTRAGLDGNTSIAVLSDEFNESIPINNPKQWLEEHGMEVYTPSYVEHKAFAESSRPVFDKWAERIGLEIVNAAKQDVADLAEQPAP